MNNKQLGSTFETKFCQELYKYGFWVHFISQNKSGQPADVIAVKNKKAYLIDCKVCSGKYFATKRIEFNQELSMNLWQKCGNGDGLFAIKTDSQVYMLPFSKINLSKNISLAEIVQNSVSLDEWVDLCE